MTWFKKILEKIFIKKRTKLLMEAEVSTNFEDNKNDFLFNLKKEADVEQDDGNGYKIIRYIRLKDMV